MAAALDIPLIDECSMEELEHVIKKAMKKTGVQKEMDLCPFLYDRVGKFSPAKFLRLKDSNRSVLRDLIREEILETKPYLGSSTCSKKSDKLPYSGLSLEECIDEAMAKLNLRKETGLCKYIPYDKGYMHHFTFLKMKTDNPVHLRNLIKANVFDKKPIKAPPKPRKKREAAQKQEVLRETPSPEENLEEELDWVVFQALRKTGLSMEDEAGLGRYFPEDYSFFHPFTYETLKRHHPRKLIALIKKHILSPKRLREYAGSRVAYENSPLERVDLRQRIPDSRIDQLIEMVSVLVHLLNDKETRRSLNEFNESFAGSENAKNLLEYVRNKMVKLFLKREMDSSPRVAFEDFFITR